MSKELSPLKTFELLCRYCVEEINILRHRQIVEDYFYNEKYEVSLTDKKTLEKGFTANIEKALKAFEIIKENLVVSYDESENDKPCLVLSIKVGKDNLVVIYETFDKEKIDLLKEVLL